jgi:hypothetical protein
MVIIADCGDNNDSSDGDTATTCNKKSDNNNIGDNNNNSAFIIPPPQQQSRSLSLQMYDMMDEYRLSVQILLLVVSVIVIWTCMSYCLWCIFALMIVSVLLCFEYRLMNIVLWACVLVLWLHGWSLGTKGKGLSLSWDSA